MSAFEGKADIRVTSWCAPAEGGSHPADLIDWPRGDSHELSTVSQDEALPVSVVALKAEGYSSDGNNVVISLRTKFSGAERKYSVPLDCFHDLIVDLQRLNASKSAEPPIQPEESAMAAE